LLLRNSMKLARALLLTTMDDIVGQRARDGGTWLVETLRSATDAGAFVQAFAEAPRRTSRNALGLLPEDVARLRAVGVTWSMTRWTLDDFARAALLLRAGEALPPAVLESVADRAYHAGDVREQQAVLRALPLLPHPDRFLGLAVHAERSGTSALFEAIACENPYPATHFPALNFNHLVLTALVSGVALDRIVGLGARVTPEVVRVANEYAAERRAAGRSVPSDLDYITEAARVVAA
jgi:hypothetical protein